MISVFVVGGQNHKARKSVEIFDFSESVWYDMDTISPPHQIQWCPRGVLWVNPRDREQFLMFGNGLPGFRDIVGFSLRFVRIKVLNRMLVC